MRRRQRKLQKPKQLHALQLKLKQPDSKLRPRHRPQRKKQLTRQLQRLKRSKNRQLVVVEIRKRIGRRIKRGNE